MRVLHVLATGDRRGAEMFASDLIRFLNTADIEQGTDAFSTPQALTGWLHAHGLIRSRRRLTEADRRRAVAFRELLREMALANNGGVPDQAVLDDVNRQVSRLSILARFEPAGVRLRGGGPGLDEALGTIAAIVAEEMLRGRWGRLKACARDVCRWVFYDHSRSGTGRWCTMAICGSRTKVRAYYRRHRRPVRPTRSRPGRFTEA